MRAALLPLLLLHLASCSDGDAADQAGDKDTDTLGETDPAPPDDTDDRPDTDLPDDTDPTGRQEIFVAEGRPAVDPEFLPSDPPLVAWQHPVDHDVWLAEVDPLTGAWVPADGKGLKLGVAASMRGAGGRPPTWNGPEWGVDADGPIVFFTAVDGSGVHQVASFRRGEGRPRWATTGGTTHRSGVLPQQAPASARLGLLYFLDRLEDLRLAWRRVGDDEDHPLPASAAPDPTPRWIPGEDALAMLAEGAGGFAQVARYDLDTRTTTPVTSDQGHKFDPFFFDAPERGERLLVTTVTQELPPTLLDLAASRIAIYRHDGEAWVRERTLGIEDHLGGAAWAHFSVEPFVVRGETWLSFVGLPPGRRGDPSQIFVARIDGSVLLRVTDPAQVAPRTDPEVLVVDDRAFLYYTVTTTDGRQRVRLVRDFLP